jgi:hypothetical protein
VIRDAVGGTEATLRWFSRLPAYFHNCFFDVYHAVADGWHAADSFVDSIAGRIMTGLKDLGSMLNRVHFFEPSEATQMIKAGHADRDGPRSGMEMGIGTVGASAGRLSRAAGLTGDTAPSA